MNGERPWSFAEAVEKQREASTHQVTAENFVREAYKQFAEAERAYREALATKIVEIRAAGASVTLCGDLARGDKHVAALKYARDVAEGVREAAAQAVWRRTADRRTVEAFCTWSMRRDLAEGYGTPGEPAPVFSRPIGARA